MVSVRIARENSMGSLVAMKDDPAIDGCAVYFSRMHAGEFASTKKLLVLILGEL